MPVERICDWDTCNELASRTPNKVGERMFCSAKCRDTFLSSEEGRALKSVHSRQGWTEHHHIVKELQALKGKNLILIMNQKVKP